MPNPEMAANARALLATEQYPLVSFRSSRVETISSGVYRLHGELTMKGIRRKITLDATLNGYAQAPRGYPGFTIQAELDRLSFGVGEEETSSPNQTPTVGTTVRVTGNFRLEVILE